MPVLQFKGRVAIEGYHHTVPHHLLETVAKLSLTDGKGAGLDGNMIVEGDNLVALKSLLPTHSGRIDCIYIDPPYNTGKEGWVYNDKLTQPQFKEWYGKVVGREGEDATRHDKWCCMIYPRLKLLRELLADDGVIFVSIDDNELHHLKALMSEIFGETNFVGTIIWKGATDNNPTLIAVEHEYILCWAKDKTQLPAQWSNPNPAAKETMLAEYNRLKDQKADPDWIQEQLRDFIKKNPDRCQPLTHYNRVDKGGPYTGSRKVHNPGKQGYFYDVIHPKTKKPCKAPARGYRYPEAAMKKLVAANKIIYGDDENQIIQIKEYLHDYKGSLKSLIELDSRTGANTLEAIFGNRETFKNPKPVELLKELLTFATDKQSIVLDSFAGSGTTAHAVLELNSEDEGTREFILIQTPYDTASASAKAKNICEEITAERVRRVIAGVAPRKGGKGKSAKEFAGLGGEFTYARVGAPLFGAFRGFEGEGPGYEELAKYVFYTETSHDFDPKQVRAAEGRIGSVGDTAFYLLYGAQSDNRNSVDVKWLTAVAEKETANKLVVYCEKLWAHRDEIRQIEEVSGKRIRTMIIPNQLK